MGCCDNINPMSNTNSTLLMSDKTLILITLVLIAATLIAFFHLLNGPYGIRFNRNTNSSNNLLQSKKRKKSSNGFAPVPASLLQSTNYE